MKTIPVTTIGPPGNNIRVSLVVNKIESIGPRPYAEEGSMIVASSGQVYVSHLSVSALRALIEAS